MILILSSILPFLLFYVSKKINYRFSYRDMFFLVPTNIIIAYVLTSHFSFFNSLILSVIICINLMSLNIDLYYQEIPDSYNLATFILGFILVLLNQSIYIPMFFTALFTFVFYLLLAILSGGGLGGGDIKMGGALGLSLPLHLIFYQGDFWSFTNYYITSLQIFINFLLFTSAGGVVMAILLVIFKGAKNKTMFPYGPAIFVGYVFMLLSPLSLLSYVISITLIIYSSLKIIFSNKELEVLNTKET